MKAVLAWLSHISLSARIVQQRKEVANLVRDEQRLTRLIERLARLAAGPKPAPKTKPGQKTSRGPAASLSGMAFPKLKGKLALPVAGEIGARFGQAREGGHSSFFSSAQAHKLPCCRNTIRSSGRTAGETSIVFRRCLSRTKESCVSSAM